MATIPFQLEPQYGLNPSNDKEYFPSKETGYPNYEAMVKRWTGAAYEEAVWENSQNEEVQRVSQQIDYIMGKQWSRRRPTYRSSPVDNRMWGLVWELVSTLTDIRPTFEVRETDQDDKKKKDIAGKLTDINKSWWLSNDVDMSLAMGVIYGLLCSGYIKLAWNEDLKMGRGDIEAIPLGPHDVLPLKARTNLQQAECIVYRSVQSLGWFRRKFPQRGQLVKPDMTYSGFSGGWQNRPAFFSQSLWDSISPQMRRVIGIEQQSRSSVYPMALYREFWFKDYTYNSSNRPVLMGRPNSSWCYLVRPGDLLYPRGRLIIMGGEDVMSDGPNPYLHGQYPFGALRLNVVPWQFGGLCYSSDTEVLTKRGWIKFVDADQDDEFATRQTGTGKFEWQKAIYFTNQAYKGKMYRFKSKSMDICVSPEHRMLVDSLPRKLGGNKNRCGETIIRAFELAKYGNHHTLIPQTSVWEGTAVDSKVFSTDVVGHGDREKPVRMTGDDYCAFMGAYLSEGWCENRTTVCVGQRPESRGYGAFKFVLSKILGTTVRYDENVFRLYRTGLARFCLKFGHSHEKYIPEDIMNATVRQLKIFWKFFVLGDGSLKKRPMRRHVREGEEFYQKISTVSQKMADQLQEIAQKIGWSASVVRLEGVPRRFPGRDKVSIVRPDYEIKVRYSRYVSVKAQEIDYDGTIHCVTVPNGILYTRRNGRPAWCGNSEVRPMMSLQDIINNTLAGILDMVKKVVNPIFYAPENAFSESVWDSLDWGMPGAKAAFNPASPYQPEFGPTPNLPSFVFQLLGWASKEMDRSSGIAAVSEALRKKQVPGTDTLESIRQAQQTPLRLKGRNIEVTLRNLGSMQIHNFFQFYTDKRRFYLPGAKDRIFTAVDWDPRSDLADYDDAYKNATIAREFEFLIEAGTLLNLNRIERAVALMRLRAMRDIDRRTLLEGLDLGLNVDEVEKRLKAEPPPPMPIKGQRAMGMPKL